MAEHLFFFFPAENLEGESDFAGGQIGREGVGPGGWGRARRGGWRILVTLIRAASVVPGEQTAACWRPGIEGRGLKRHGPLFPEVCWERKREKGQLLKKQGQGKVVPAQGDFSEFVGQEERTGSP